MDAGLPDAVPWRSPDPLKRVAIYVSGTKNSGAVIGASAAKSDCGKRQELGRDCASCQEAALRRLQDPVEERADFSRIKVFGPNTLAACEAFRRKNCKASRR
jgi:hypothetical protein